MKQEKRDKLRHWFENLEHSKQIDIALECIEELIFTESIRYWNDSKVPHWEASGDRLDGSKPNDEDYE